MKKYLFTFLLFGSIMMYASSATKAYLKAQAYEKNGDFKQAMIYYKKAAALSMPLTIVENNASTKSNPDAPIAEFGVNHIDGYKNRSTDKTVQQIIESNFDIKAYKMNYLLPLTYDFVNHAGRKDTETKFQISFKKSLAKNLLGLQDELFLGYTQTSWWQTSAPSSPFRETNYEPELFMMIPNANEQSALKAYKVGLVHQSNGQGGLASRSWNRVYVSAAFQKYGFFIIPRAWYRLPEKKKRNITDPNGDDNPDIYDYLGYGDVTISYPYKQNFFTLLIRNNLKFDSNNKGAIQFDWTFPIKNVKDMFGYIQIFSGYGESLIDYNKRNDRIGIGFALTR
ncbi:phospholipase A [Sulfurospirillum sp. 1612]|uniref:phospholipase A n=1 Tax=Sulfurospirillum sp. 1612 TaxID=3094835 RepID=UPI002F928701